MVIDLENSDLKPSSMAQYLGMLIDTIQEKVFPMYSWIVRFQDLTDKFLLLPTPPAKIWQQLLCHMASHGASQDVFSSVATEDLLVSSSGQSCKASPSFQIVQAALLVASRIRRKGSSQEFLSRFLLQVPPLCLLLFTNASSLGWGTCLQNLTEESGLRRRGSFV